METQWQCRFKNPPQPITVGDKLLLLCEGGKKSPLKRPLYIKLSEKQKPYSLKILKTLESDDYFIALEAAPYRVGIFQGPLILTDGEKELLIEDFSFQSESVLQNIKNPPQPQGPFGPFYPPMTLWLFASAALSLAIAAAGFFVFIRRLLKRKKFIQNVLCRNSSKQPAKFFIIEARKEQKNPAAALNELEKLFKTFLEDTLFIPALHQTNKQFMKNLKRHQYPVYKKEGLQIQKILNEFTALKSKTPDKAAVLKLKRICQAAAFALDNKSYKKKRAAK